jgi:hypothetical protein
VINIPVDVNEMVSNLPRHLDDDYAFNVHIKRHLIHKSKYLSGYIKKSTVKKWLNFLITKPLYKNYGIRIDESVLNNINEPINLPPVDASDTNANEIASEPMIEPISEDPEHINDLLLARQHTLMWSEEKYLELAPGINKRHISLLFDEHAEELSFPSIYLGEPRTFTLDKVTPYMMAHSEIRRTDRRGVKPEHILYMAMKVMRMRLTDGMYCTFKTNNLKQLTRQNIEDKQFMDNMIEQNLSFLKSVPNSVQYWMSRKKDVFAMIRQLGKPTLFLTLSANEYSWPDLLRILYRLEKGREWTGEGDPVTSMSSDLRTTLVNEDPVTCCLYFDKLVDTIMFLLKSKSYSPFGRYRVLDYFKRIEFQQRGSPHAHLLLWLANDPSEPVDENMPGTLQLIDSLISVDETRIEREKLQTHIHTFTCYKRARDEENRVCRFGAPFWPVEHTVVLLPLTKDDGRRRQLKQKYADMHHSLEFDEDFESLNAFLQHHHVENYDYYLNILRAGITRPKVFLKRSIQQCWINNFNPWVAKVLRSNTDIQFILEEYSCATYVVEYVNKTNRGMSNLQRELIKLRDEYPDKDYSALLTEVGLKMLNAVEISAQEAAWYLLTLKMSESSRKVEYIPTTWPHERQHVRKSKKQMDDEELGLESTNIWHENIIEKYQSRPQSMETVSLAQFVSYFYQQNKTKEYKRREFPKVIRYCQYQTSELR